MLHLLAVLVAVSATSAQFTFRLVTVPNGESSNETTVTTMSFSDQDNVAAQAREFCPGCNFADKLVGNTHGLCAVIHSRSPTLFLRLSSCLCTPHCTGILTGIGQPERVLVTVRGA
jgi:hypothetical protein